MDDLLSEKEQIEQMRSWWSEYGGYVIVGVAAGALLLFGVNYYQNSKLAAQLEASALYETLTNHVVAGNLDAAESAADQLGTDFADTSYAAQSKLAIARLYMDKNRDQDAADVLNELLDGSAGEALKPIARLRLARILAYQDKHQDVVDLLEGQDNPAFAAAYGEVLGDAYHALGRIADAQAAYQQVLMDPLSQGTVNQQLVQWKALDLPEVQTDEPGTDAALEPATEPSIDAAVESSESDDVEETVE
ncbi:MAG: tetratricopeptide repeat protein [Gammaproteobacteria bacterium]|nr:tetratricopeptide repeat protein [Gammaproteobacteria bacterium]MBU2678108.1 tetratricopeptide repeat protein [Gammaproteobacteria bacterium]NNC56156.1 tetratricopeptide repeat protein [Woeseiaceae bacterium]NNL51843.1 tetratricopeptide repeat protein [Woeseiaceae bacterium]